MSDEFSVRRLTENDTCVCNIESRCYPPKQCLGPSGILSFLRSGRGFGLAVVRYDRTAVAKRAYENYLARRGRYSPDNPLLRHRDWTDAVFQLGTRVGFALCSVRVSSVHLDRLGIDPEFRGKGLGRMALQGVAREMRQWNQTRVLMILEKEILLGAKGFSQRLGFAETGATLDCNTVVLEKVSANGNNVDQLFDKAR